VRILVVGLGSIGRRHLDNLRRLEPDADITMMHQRAFTVEAALRAKPDAALICGPASMHVETALPLARAGVHLFIEKPLATSTDDAAELVALCGRARLTLAVGYNLRFVPSLRAFRAAFHGGAVGRLASVRAEVGQYLPDWRPGSDYRRSVSASAELGGGVALELSHEIDYVRWLCGEVEEVFARAGQLSELEIDVEDTLEMLIRFEGGALGSIHLDMTQRKPVRTCRLMGTEGALQWDGIAAGDIAGSYSSELADFLTCVRNGKAPIVTGADALRTLELVLAAKASARESRPISVRCVPAHSA
jgi:predicted dehydrogenase